MKFPQLTSLSLLFAAALATPTPARTIQERSTTYCGQYDQVVSSNYTIYTDVWGKSAATSGSQCLTLVSDTAGKLAWSTNWTWVGGSSSVKSYSNVALTKTGIQVSKISSIPTVWNWRYFPLSSFCFQLINGRQLHWIKHRGRRLLRPLHSIFANRK